MKYKLTFTIGFFIILGACTVWKQPIIVEYDTIPDTKNQNVCTYLKDSVLIYAVFVDVGIYYPWTEFEIEATLDSLKSSTNWLVKNAKSNTVNLDFSIVQHKQSSKLTINEKRAHHSLSINGLVSPNAKTNKKFHSWADAISIFAGKGLKYIPSTKIDKKLKILSKEDLILALRDKYKMNNVALIFFVNGFNYKHPSYSYFTESNGCDAEFSIVTSRNPAIISHEILHLFGAVDLYPTFNYPNFNYQRIALEYPNEIMRIQHKSIEKLMVSPISKYFIGWQDTISYSDTQLLLHKKSFLSY